MNDVDRSEFNVLLIYSEYSTPPGNTHIARYVSTRTDVSWSKGWCLYTLSI